MTPPPRDGGEVACDVAAPAAVDDIERGVAADVCGAGVEAWVVCLFGCWDEAPALEREEGVCRKAAKKVERKKGRWDDMLMLGERLSQQGGISRIGAGVEALRVADRGLERRDRGRDLILGRPRRGVG